MKHRIQALMAVAVVGACLAVAGPAWAAPKTVCPKNCQFSSIQAAINAASPGDTITIAAGKYYENVVVSQSVTLQGSGDGTVIYPAVSGPACTSGGGSLCPGGSNVILVQSNNVTITNLRVEGDNPNLTSGVVAGGDDIDARNGIITNHALGVYDNLTVSNVKVADVYLRGIYASSGGTFNFNHDTIDTSRPTPHRSRCSTSAAPA
jgi:nitrous oxidase accessory protein NosD